MFVLALYYVMEQHSVFEVRKMCVTYVVALTSAVSLAQIYCSRQ